MNFEIEGSLHKKYETESKTSSFQTREFVIQTSGNYPQFVKFQLVQDKCDIIEKMDEGGLIKVSFDLRGREWQGKYFTNLNAWKVEMASSSPSISHADDARNLPPDFDTAEDSQYNPLVDDLPF